MIKVALVDTTGSVTSVVSPSTDSMYEDGAVYGDHVAVHIPYTEDDLEVITAWYRKAGEWRVRPPKPSIYHAWDVVSESWTADTLRACEDRKAEVDSIRRDRLDMPIAYAGSLFDADATARLNVSGWQTQLLAGMSLPEGFVWRDADNVDHPADASFINGLGAAMVGRGTTLYRSAWLHKQNIEGLASADLSVILSYDVSSGW